MSLVTESHDSPANLLTPAVQAAPLGDVAACTLRCFRIGAGVSKDITKWSARALLAKTTRLNFWKDGLSTRRPNRPCTAKLRTPCARPWNVAFRKAGTWTRRNPLLLRAANRNRTRLWCAAIRTTLENVTPAPVTLPWWQKLRIPACRRDRVFKKRIYAAAGIAVYWVVNLVDRQVEVYADCSNAPSGPDYARCDIFTVADNVPLVVDGRTVAEIPAGVILP